MFTLTSRAEAPRTAPTPGFGATRRRFGRINQMNRISCVGEPFHCWPFYPVHPFILSFMAFFLVLSRRACARAQRVVVNMVFGTGAS